MRDEYLRERPRHDNRPERDGDDEPVDLIARERREPGEEGYGREHVGGEDDKAHPRPGPGADAERKCHGVPEHRRAAELVDKGVVSREVGDAGERPGRDEERQAERKRSHEREREGCPLEGA